MHCNFIIAWLFLLSIFQTSAESFDDSILFRMNWGTPQEKLLNDPSYSKLLMTSNNNEKFECLVPISTGPTLSGTNTYKGPNALELIWPLLKAQTCIMKVDSYWTYEICHGSILRQFHDDRDGKGVRQQEYILGRLSTDDLTKLKNQMIADLDKNPTTDPPKTNIAGVRMPYFVIDYNDGTVCDVTGRPRQTRVLYVCYEEGRNAIYKVKEIYSCEYEVTVLTPLLCDHPSYRPEELSQTNLYCFSQTPDLIKPKNLMQIEQEEKNPSLWHSSKLDPETIRVRVTDGKNEEFEMILDTHAWGSRRTEFPLKPPVDNPLVQSFFEGEYCLQGGTGWWNFELCYGRSVTQFHLNPDGSKTSILLGLFDEDTHIEWMENKPSRKPSTGSHQVSHFYASGDVCEETSKQRQVEVRLKCKEGMSATAVTLYLMEPKTCEYVLGVESPLVCSLVGNFNEYGLLKKDAKIQFEATEQEKDMSQAEMEKSKEPEKVEPVPPQEDKGQSETNQKRDLGDL